ncbi:oligosaccharide flippase family protein [Bradyrhizobium sp.]|jgi:O-antigen/teichoic acid export membrane protein|uniref:oligosaccharide flippase family protein n=1 Tax=Bradyrhizobium sp. TaxID=376 RepID=UPI003C296F30
MVRNISHLGLGQVASTALGIVLIAVIGRALEPAQLGIFYLVFAISSFVNVIVDWGQSIYLVREMARGRIDEPELIGSALLTRVATNVFSSAIAIIIALALGYDGQVVALMLLAMAAGVPVAALFMPLDCSFRAKDRMDIDAFANIVGKAITLVATAIALHFGGGLTEVILMQGVGNISTLLAGIIAAQRLGIAVKPPVMKTLRELVRHGAPIAAFSLVVASQPFLEILLLSALAGPAVVGWYGASRNIFGVVTSPALILLGATFPELSRTSLSLPDFRRTIDATERVLCLAAAFSSSALYLFADHIVAIIYGHGRFEETAAILRVSAIFIPLLFFTFLWASVLSAVGRNKALAVVSMVRIAVFAALSWLLIGYWQQRFGNGGIALVIIAGVAEIPAMIAYLALLPRGAVGSATALNVVRACIASLCTVAPLSMLQPLELWYLTPLFAALFVLIAMVTRLILPSDVRLAIEVVRNGVLAPRVAKSTPDGSPR